MINRVGNVEIFSDSSFEQLANVLKEQEKKKLYKICSTESKAKIVESELRVNGFKCQIEKIGNNYNVYKVLPEMIELDKATQEGSFKKLAWGRYVYQRSASLGDFADYNFDDGSIWRVMTDENGKEYLIKEVDDFNEDRIIRTKTAGMEKTAAYTNDSNINNIIKIIYSSDINQQFISDIIMSSAKQGLFTMLDDKIESLINERAQQKNIIDQSALSGLKEYISTNIASNSITDSNSFYSKIDERIEEIIKAMEIL